LGNEDAVALYTGGFGLTMIAGQLQTGAAWIDRALALDPNLAAAWHASGWVRIFLGDAEIAIEHFARGLRLNPVGPENFASENGTAAAHFLAGRYTDALKWSEKALQTKPNYAPAMRMVAASYACVDRLTEAQQTMTRMRQFDPDLCVANLAGVTLPRAHYDVIFARWVFLFLPDPAAHVRQLAAALAPRGVLAIEDYQRETLRMIPAPPTWEAFLAADRDFFESQGGHASIAGELPTRFTHAGLRMVEVTPTVRSGHPGAAVWTWLSTYFLDIMPRLVGLGGFTAAHARQLTRDWIAASKEPTSLLLAPALIDVVGRKKRT
jgi:SAM-dependent methyltransferase